SWWSLSYMRLVARAALPRLKETTIGPEGIGIAVAVAFLSSMLAGVLSAMRSRQIGLHGTLGSTVVYTRKRGLHLRGYLVMCQYACALILLAGAGLLLKSLHNLFTIELGFNPYQVLTFYPRLSVSDYSDPGARSRYCQHLEQRLTTVPGIQAIGRTSLLPFGDAPGRLRTVRPNRDPQIGRDVTAIYSNVSTGYFKAMGIPVLRGRS